MKESILRFPQSRERADTTSGFHYTFIILVAIQIDNNGIMVLCIDILKKRNNAMSS